MNVGFDSFSIMVHKDIWFSIWTAPHSIHRKSRKEMGKKKEKSRPNPRKKEIELIQKIFYHFLFLHILGHQLTRKQAPAERQKRCVVRDEEDHMLQTEDGSDRWKSGQTHWTEVIFQQVQLRNKLSILLSCPQPNRPPIPPWSTASLSHLNCLIFRLSHGSCCCFIVVSNHIRRCWEPLQNPVRLSLAVRWRGSWRDWTGKRLQVQMVSAPRVLKACADQLCGILQQVPAMWKISCLVSISKRSNPSSPNDYRPVARTSHYH